MEVAISLGGGAELLFVDKKKFHNVTLPQRADGIWTLATLLPWLKENLIKERPELLISNGTVRPGILVLINDADWELLGQLNYQIQPGDNITFISTLHGG